MYERQALLENKITNFDTTLKHPNNEQVKELLKDPYIFDFITTSNNKDLKELDIEQELTRNITKLLLELGNGFAFIGRQYHLEIDNEDYYIDLLFYNLKVRCYVVIELKTTEFKPEYAGKLNFYLRKGRKKVFQMSQSFVQLKNMALYRKTCMKIVSLW